MISIFPSELRARLSEFVTLRLGLRFAPDRWDDLERGAVAAAKELGFVDPIDWTERLMAGISTFTQLQTLANQLTVGETYFFRQTEVFTALQEKVFPELIQARRAKRELRIWSAGCSTGEEPYSLAILLHQILPDLAGWRIVIAGTDVSTHSLNKAAKGLYSEWSFRQTPSWVKQNYFTPAGPRDYQISAKIREAVRFSYLNLVESSYPSFLGGPLSFDLIVCRNVLMYFSADWQDDIIHRMGHQLAPDGYLLLGPCDVIAGLKEDFSPAQTAYGFYQKNRGLKPPLWFPPHGAITPPLEMFPPSFVLPTVSFERRVSSQTEKMAPLPQSRSVRSEVGAVSSSVVGGLSLSELLAGAKALADQGKLADALVLCDQAVAADKLDPHARYLLGCIFQEMGDIRKAADEYRSTLYLAPEHIMAHLALASYAREGSRWALARRHYRQADRALSVLNRGEIVTDSDGLTAGRMRELITELISTAHG